MKSDVEMYVSELNRSVAGEAELSDVRLQ